MATKTKLSPIAKNILHGYRLKAKGREMYLTSVMQKALVADAMYYEMLNEFVRRPDAPISSYVEAMLEVLNELEL